ncbi:unnamed protein product [Camellia sinensis]
MESQAFFIFFFSSFASLLSSTFLKFSIAGDTLASNQSLRDGDTLVSTSQRFELGFFSPGSSKFRYLGIWYKATPDTVVWVANRNNPITGLQGVLTISGNRSLVLLNGTQSIVWSSNLSRVEESPVAQLLDSGNLVLFGKTETNSDSFLWQSFDFPCNMRIPDLKMGENNRTSLDQYLTSWKSADDPSPGEFTYRVDNHGLPQLVLRMGSIKKYRSWVKLTFINLPLYNNPAFKTTLEFNNNRLIYIYEPYNSSVFTRLTLNESGLLQRYILNKKNTWDLMFTVPRDLCDSYGYCGPNGICRIYKSPLCECLKGFIPNSQQEWDVLDWSSGCVRSVPLDCQNGEGFVKVLQVKLPDLLEFRLNIGMSIKECEEECLKNCSCIAYANSNISGGGSGCLMWFGDLIDIRESFQDNSEQDIYIRLPASAIDSIHDSNNKKRLVKILLLSATLGILTLGTVCGSIIMKVKAKRRALNGNKESLELPLFDFTTIAAATSNFSDANMIGEGGFGPVYKGKLSTEQEIAVKRLSKGSGQGLEEFKNEVTSIAKLQHRNLVRLLGCCIQGEERMLIYEYMCNKSLNYFIYDQNRSTLLAWQKRFDIVMGIARGLLYLHQDSRLRIIHRDLKASNILLDNDLIPKISDFGLARIFEGEQICAKTKRVIGTYGYMSPEYAIDGKFSVKSDVFSLGVLLLEIVSGKRNRGFHHPDHHHNLLGHAWLLWNEDRALELMDACLKDSCVESQVQRCIQVGLLCVQKLPQDRPAMSSVVFMLGNEEAILPQPKQPGFFIERSSIDADTATRSEEFYTNGEVPITILDAR